MHIMDSWIKRIESKFEERKKNLGGLKKALEALVGKTETRLINKNDKLATEYEEFIAHTQSEREKAKRKGNKPDFLFVFLETIIAKYFYPEQLKAYYKEWGEFLSGSIFCTGSGNKKQGYYYATLNDYWVIKEDDKKVENKKKDKKGKKITNLNFDITDSSFISSTNNSKKEPEHIYGFEICSALQRESNYTAFESLEGLNNFVMSLNDLNKPNALSNFGFYSRNVNDLCIAYSILHGYSVEEARVLITEAINVLKSKGKRDESASSVKTMTAEIANEFEESLNLEDGFKVDDNSKEAYRKDFIEKVGKNADGLFCEMDMQKAHRTTVKYINEKVSNINNDPIYDNNEKDYQIILEGVRDILVDNILNNYIEQLQIDGLCKYILERLNIEDLYENSLGNVSENDVLIDAWRCTYIILTMYDMKESGCCTNTFEALNKLNSSLYDAFYREIDYRVEQRKLINNTQDLFDWFIIECIKLDEQECHEEECGISGYDVFVDYINQKLTIAEDGGENE